jgi:hypothetical protein
MAKESDLLLAKTQKTMKVSAKNQNNESLVTAKGLMVLGKSEKGLHTADFACCDDDLQVEPFTGKFKMQIMRDGNVYATELPKRIKGKPLFREDNATLSLGKDGRYYFVFSLPEEMVDQLSERLIRQARAIARKAMTLFIEH